MNQFYDSLASKLEKTRLEVKQTGFVHPEISVLRAWQKILNVSTVPTSTLPREFENLPGRVDAQWMECAKTHSIFSEDGAFLLSVAGSGVMDNGWARVRLTRETKMSQFLVGSDGFPEFLAMSEDAERVCGVTIEEEAVWIVCERTNAEGE